MLDVILDTLLDGLKLVPFLFVAFLIIELLEHKLNKKNLYIIRKSGKLGPVVGSFLGMIPQCGFSVLITNLYVTRVVSIGTLIAIYLSTSDEMLPILISEHADIKTIIYLLSLKFIIGLIAGIVIDLIYQKLNKNQKLDCHICEDEHCHCDKGIFKSVCHHTFNILLFVLLITFILNLLFTYTSEEFISKLFLKNSFFGPFLASLIGLIPNCGSSVILSELYLNKTISLGSTVAGLLTNSGLSLIVLFKTNKNLKENISILLLIYFIGSISGLLIDIITRM